MKSPGVPARNMSLRRRFLADCPNASWGPLGNCPALRDLLRLRPDIAGNFDLQTESGLAGALAWFYVRAVSEYGLGYLLDDAILKALNAPAATYPFHPDVDVQAAAIAARLLPFTILMGLAWRQRSDVRQVYDIGTVPGRLGFCLWFVSHGVAEMKLQPLITPEWQETLLSPLSDDGAQSRLALLAWMARPDLRTTFDINTLTGQAQLELWLEHAIQTEPGWGWLAKSAVIKQPDTRWQSIPDSLFGVNLIGFAKGELGIGEDMRMAVAACEAAGIPYALVNVSTGSNTRQTDDALSHRLQEAHGAPYPVNIFCLTGFETFRVFYEQGAGLFTNRYNIGWWPWELPVWPEAWNMVFDLVSEVWAATRFTRQMYIHAQMGCEHPLPVIHMPLPAEVSRVKPITRKTLGLPEKPFLFLYIFDFNSYLARKNPFAALRAFRDAFPANDRTVGLVLKTMNSNPQDSEWQRFVRECAKDRRVRVLDKTLDRGEVLGLVDACDAYVSLHRSEGFGRTMAEAMLFGKPVVGTDFSGNVDFLKPGTGFPVSWTKRTVKPGEYPFVTETDGAWWAEPDIADAARQLQAARLAAQDRQFTKCVKLFAEEQFSPERVGALMKQRLSGQDLGGWIRSLSSR